MASLKDKYLESAQKFIIKGQYDRAIKDYREIISLDSDIRHRQRLAELLVKGGYRDEAIAEYEAIAKYYDNNHFYVKAIAVQKQIQKLDPDNINISLSLAELNYKQGLIGNCLAEYKTVHDYYEKNGNVIDAVRILETMLSVDPENLNIQLKLAESRFSAGFKEEAYETFNNLAGVLKKKGDAGLLDQIIERMNKLFPDRAHNRLDLLAEKLKSGDAASAVNGLREIADTEPDLRVFSLLLEASRTAGDMDTFRESCSRMIELFPEEIVPRRELVNLAIEEGDPSEALRLLRTWAADFSRLNAGLLFHDFCLNVGALAGGNRELLQQVALLDPEFTIPSEDAHVQPADELTSTVEIEPAVFDMEMAGESPFSSVETIPPTLAEEQWEEDIDLSLPGEELAILSEEPASAGELDSFELIEPSIYEGEGESVSGVEEIFPEEQLSLSSDMIEVVLTEEDLARQDWQHATAELEEVTSPGAEVSLGSATVAQEEADATFELISDAEACDFFGSLEEFDLVPEELAPSGEDQGVTSKYSFDGLFTEFKKSLDSQVERGDTETHFNLGIAYKEMGLYDDAIEEFNVSTTDPARRVDSISLQGACYREKGDFKAAERVLSEGAVSSAPGSEAYCILMYELGSLFETAERSDAAVDAFEKVKAVNPVFRDVLERISLLKGEEEALDLCDSELLEDM